MKSRITHHQPVFRTMARAMLILTTALFAVQVSAQAGNAIRSEYPELADLFNAFDVSQATAFEKLSAINSNPQTMEARMELRMHLDMMKNMTMSEMMAAGMGHGQMQMTMVGPYGDLELDARVELLQLMRGSYSDDEVAEAFVESAALDRHTAEVLAHGRRFENRLFEIYIDDSISNKRAAVNAAIENYLSDNRHSVATFPKQSDLLLSHEYANGFKASFPRVSGFLWTQQWLQLAALQAVILENLDDQFANGMETVMERFWNKVGSEGGMTMYPAPNELPMAPAIAPDLYSQSPEAAFILDNLNILETLVSDILFYPNLENRESLIAQAVSLFTDKDTSNVETYDYLLFALRGGIYNQGGPAVGELMQSERNRAREMMDMQHSMIMSSGQ